MRKKPSGTSKGKLRKVIAAVSRLNVEKEIPTNEDLAISKGVQKGIFTVALLLCLASLASAMLLGYEVWEAKILKQQEARELGEEQVAQAAGQISAELDKFATLTNSIADDLSSGALPYDELTERIEHEMRINPDLLGITVAFAPNMYKDDVELFAPYYSRDKEGAITSLQVEELYDYTQPPSEAENAPDTLWYYQPMQQGETWLEPYFGAASAKLLSGYAVPFYQGVAPVTDDAAAEDNVATEDDEAEADERQPVGVVVVDLPLSNADRLMDSLDLGATGYGYILSKEGLFIAHPIKELIGTTTIFQHARELRDDTMREVGKKAVRGQSFFLETVDNVTGQQSWIFHEPIPATGWSIGVVLYKQEFAPNPRAAMRQLSRVALLAVSFLFFLSIVGFGAHRGGIRSLWNVSGIVTLLGIALIGFIWYLAADLRNQQGVTIVNKSGLNRFLSSYSQKTYETTGESPIYIPTGVLIQTIQFGGPNDVTLGGYIWQKYPEGLDETITRGFVLPQQGGWDVIKEPYSVIENGVETIGWKFLIPLRQPFNPFKYPFDNEDILLRIRHPDLDRNVLLVPDLESYELIKPDLLPGLDDEIVIEGRLLDQTFFSYRMHSYNTSLGVEGFGAQEVPEMYYNISIRRDFIDSLVGHIIPIVVVLLMMFIVMLITHDPDPKEVLSVLSYAAALFFVAAIAHATLRDAISATGIIYFEYFYIMIYVVILITSVNSIIYNTQPHIKIFQYKQNLIPKLLYGPFVLSILAVLTFQTYVPKKAEQASGQAQLEEPFKVALIASVAGIEDGRLQQKTWEGIQEAIEELGIEPTLFEAATEEAYNSNVEQATAEGYDLVFTVGSDMANFTYQAASLHPDLLFVTVDNPAKPDRDNLQGITFQTDETGILAGYLAAEVAHMQDPDEPMVGYVAGEQMQQIVRLVSGYDQGVRLYNQDNNTNVVFDGVYVGAFNVPDEGKAEAQALIEDGFDIILASGGTTGDGALIAAREQGIPAIGMDVDQFETRPEEQSILVSSNVKRVETVVQEIIKNTMEGDFQGGHNYIGTLENGGLGLAPFHTFDEQLSEDFKTKLQEIRQKVIDGKVWTGWGDIGGIPKASQSVPTAPSTQISANVVQAIVSSDQASVKLSQRAIEGEGKLFLTLSVSTTGTLEGKEFALIDHDEPLDVMEIDDTLKTFIHNNKIVGDDSENYRYYSGTLRLDAKDTATFVLTSLRERAGEIIYLHSYYLEADKELALENLNLIQQVQLNLTPEVADAKDESKIHIGVIQTAETPSQNDARKGFQESLKDQGYGGRDVMFDIQFAEGDPDKAKTIAEEFVANEVDLIYSLGTPASRACVSATHELKTPPIVFSSVTDPLGAGLVESLEKPGGNATGMTDRSPFEQQFDLMLELLPDVKTLGIVYNPAQSFATYEFEALKRVGEERDIEVIGAEVKTAAEGDVAAAAEKLIGNVDAIHVPADNDVFAAFEFVVDVCNENRIPLFIADTSYVAQGAIAAVSVNSYDLGYQAGKIVVRILEGEDPGDIPVGEAEDLEIWVNPNAAQLQGVTIPESVLQEADKVLVVEEKEE